MGSGQKSYMLVWRCHQLLFAILANCHLHKFSQLLANEKGNNEVKLVTVLGSPGIYLTAEENLSLRTVK